MTDDLSLHLSDPPPTSRRFASKVDRWLVVVLFSPLVVMLGLLLAGLREPAVYVPLMAAQGLMASILARTSYTVGDSFLIARSGPFQFRVPLASIRSLTPSRSAWSSPALSIDRIAVVHATGRLLVSPRNRAGFVRAIAAAAPHVQVSGLSTAASPESDEPEPSFNAAVVPLVALAVIGAAFGAWQFYASTRAPDAVVTGDALSISGLYSTTISRRDLVRIALVDQLSIGPRVQGFAAGRYRRGIFEIEGLGPSRVFVARDATPILIIHTRTQPVVIGFDDPERTRQLHAALLTQWRLAPSP